jgi:hypothetical protein
MSVCPATAADGLATIFEIPRARSMLTWRTQATYLWLS